MIEVEKKSMIRFATDQYVINRLEGFSPEESFLRTALESHRFLMDFVYHSNECISDDLYSEMNFVLKDIRFTQKAELVYLDAAQKIKIPAM